MARPGHLLALLKYRLPQSAFLDDSTQEGHPDIIYFSTALLNT